MTDVVQLDPRFVQGVTYFNAGAFFDAHEVWEDLWHDCHDATRTFYQGLIQVAVCLHHFRNRNTRGARTLCRGATAYLEPYTPMFRRVDVTRLLRDLHACCAEILADEGHNPRGTLNPNLIPKIQLEPAPVDAG